LAPKYEQLASVYADNTDYASKVTVAKIDATANDIPDAIQGFPTIKLYPAGSKGSPVEYSGSRTVEDLAAFIKANGKHQVDAVADLAKLAEEAAAPSASASAASDSASASASSATEAATASETETAAPEATEEAAPEHDEL
jgi:protein disulfide-isomerase A1